MKEIPNVLHQCYFSFC